MGIVPVGLTGYRSLIPPHPPGRSNWLGKQLHGGLPANKTSGTDWDRDFVYLADEFYLRAGLDIPEAQYYDDYCQIENGIGWPGCCWMNSPNCEPDLPRSSNERKVYILTGRIRRVGIAEGGEAT